MTKFLFDIALPEGVSIWEAKGVDNYRQNLYTYKSLKALAISEGLIWKIGELSVLCQFYKMC